MMHQPNRGGHRISAVTEDQTKHRTRRSEHSTGSEKDGRDEGRVRQADEGQNVHRGFPRMVQTQTP